MFFGTRTVEIAEYSSADTRIVNKGFKLIPLVFTNPWPPVSFGPLRLIGEWVKSIHANDLPSYDDDLWAKLEATSTCQRLTAQKHALIGSNLRLRECLVGGLDGIRDFSKSERIGEYGQAVCLIFVQDRLHYPIVFDFDVFCSLVGAGPLATSEKKPDYVGWDGLKFILVESKSSLGSNSIKTSLREGLQQCDAGSARLAPVGFVPAASYCVLTAFQLDTSGTNTCINFADPPGEPSAPDGTHKLVVAAYYQNALQAFGWFGRLPLMLTDEAERRTRRFESMGAREFIELPGCEKPLWIEELSPEIGVYGGDYSLWIDEQVLEALRSEDGNVFNEAIQGIYREIEGFEGDTDGDAPFVQVFRDGLVMVLERPDQFPIPDGSGRCA